MVEYIISLKVKDNTEYWWYVFLYEIKYFSKIMLWILASTKENKCTIPLFNNTIISHILEFSGIADRKCNWYKERTLINLLLHIPFNDPFRQTQRRFPPWTAHIVFSPHPFSTAITPGRLQVILFEQSFSKIEDPCWKKNRGYAK